MSEARGFLKLAQKYERRMRYCREEMIKNRDVYIPQLRGIIECAVQYLEITYGEMESWANTMQTVFAVDDANTWLQKIELWLMKKFVCYRYSQTIKEADIVETAKRQFESMLNTLEVMNAFRRL